MFLLEIQPCNAAGSQLAALSRAARKLLFLCFYTIEYKKDGPGCILQKINLLDDVSPDVFALYSLVLERHYGRAEQKVPGNSPAWGGTNLWYSFLCASLQCSSAS